MWKGLLLKGGAVLTGCIGSHLSADPLSAWTMNRLRRVRDAHRFGTDTQRDS